MSDTRPEAGPRCPECGSDIAPALLSCPKCGRLVHADRIKVLSGQARQVESGGKLVEALATWRQMLDLLPTDSRQYTTIADKVASLSSQVDAAGGGTDEPGDRRTTRSSWLRGAAGLGTVGLVLWKLKFLVGFVLTKGKILLLGLTKASTIFSMLLSLGLYWTLWGWKFAAPVWSCPSTCTRWDTWLPCAGMASAPRRLPSSPAWVRSYV